MSDVVAGILLGCGWILIGWTITVAVVAVHSRITGMAFTVGDLKFALTLSWAGPFALLAATAIGAGCLMAWIIEQCARDDRPVFRRRK